MALNSPHFQLLACELQFSYYLGHEPWKYDSKATWGILENTPVPLLFWSFYQDDIHVLTYLPKCLNPGVAEPKYTSPLHCPERIRQRHINYYFLRLRCMSFSACTHHLYVDLWQPVWGWGFVTGRYTWVQVEQVWRRAPQILVHQGEVGRPSSDWSCSLGATQDTFLFFTWGMRADSHANLLLRDTSSSQKNCSLLPLHWSLKACSDFLRKGSWKSIKP